MPLHIVQKDLSEGRLAVLPIEDVGDRGCAYLGYYAVERVVITPKSGGTKSFDKARTRSGERLDQETPRLICDTQSVARTNLSDVHCALIQFSDPVTFTDTSEMETRSGFPSKVPR
jgi:hypothetical protein